ncbi:hypothetical protein LOTGIDRAFT_203816 [Lottia gigantea]|uniref:EF-hand domain-containing protein n=1 Tax=Lottia gigantea TaxID=225164 RepID=V4AFP0_LOTGI|nr:hypothetical protein LOTGIDRAFT_203816 [Lottia gigantea]ESO95707.1 hypothetical protein LOTGIDRAFT_203816 [Lottia gigantea]
MAATGKEPMSSIENDAVNYLDKHKIMELFNNLTSQLIYQRPDDPKKFMIENLEKLQKSKQSKVHCNNLFDDSNIRSVFGMLDPTGKGHITVKQYREAMETLGIKKFSQTPTGHEDDMICMETFFTDAKKGLEDSASTFAAQ